MIVCGQCQETNPPEDAYCVSCGYRLTPGDGFSLPLPIFTEPVRPNGSGHAAASPEGPELARARLLQLFQYIKQYHHLESPPKLQWQAYEWKLGLHTLPQAPEIERGDARLGEDEESPEFLLRVRRPAPAVPCPEPPEVLSDWLKEGWNRADRALEVVPEKSFPHPERPYETLTVRYADDPSREAAWRGWASRRDDWAAAERLRKAVDEQFTKLYELHGRLKRESDAVELVLGDGHLRWQVAQGAKTHTIEHPLILQRAVLEFDPDRVQFTVRDAETPPELAGQILAQLTSVDAHHLQEIRSDFESHLFHPLARRATTGYLRRVAPRLSSRGRFAEGRLDTAQATDPVVFREPLLFLAPRSQGYVQAMEAILAELSRGGPVPRGLMRVAGVEPGPPERAAEETGDLLFTRPANDRQELVATRLAETGTVLVQGPPGTGKTHTITNLVSHLLAQGKRILITSHTSKALRVVREQVVPELRPLCVSALDRDTEGRSELAEAVSAITGRLEAGDAGQLEQKAARLAEQRRELQRKLRETRERLLGALREEYRELFEGHRPVSHLEAAQFLGRAGTQDGWIPGRVQQDSELPLAPTEVLELYRLNERLPQEDERDLRGRFPLPQEVPSPGDFRALTERLAELEASDLQGGAALWEHEEQDEEVLRRLLARVEATLGQIEERPVWYLEAVEAGRLGGDHPKAWDRLLESIEADCGAITQRLVVVKEHGPEVGDGVPRAEQKELVAQILGHLRGGGNLSWWTLLLKPRWKAALEQWRVSDGAEPASRVEHFEALQALLECEELRIRIGRFWDRMTKDLEGPASGGFLAPVEQALLPYASDLREALAWSRERWGPCEQALNEAGVRWQEIARVSATRTERHGYLRGMADGARVVLRPALEARLRWLECRRLHRSRESLLEGLAAFPEAEDPGRVVEGLRRGVRERNADQYEAAWTRLAELNRQREHLERRSELLTRLYAAAPVWAEALRERRPPHHLPEPPGDSVAAWRFRRFEQEFERREGENLTVLQDTVAKLSDELRKVTSDFVDCRTWARQLRRIGLKQQMSLTQWVKLEEQARKGTGKRAPALKAEARRVLSTCADAVPVWIMPLSRVAESFHMGQTRFDVVILDEASQCDMKGLVAAALADDVVVVGDDQQVSPEAVGVSLDAVGGLIATHLQGFPGAALWDGRRSLYDVARECFGGTILLQEHFRCAPPIIEFSNGLSYHGQIRPLRDSSTLRLAPATLAHRVKGARTGVKVNLPEAEEIAALVAAVCEDPDYEGCSLGVISMVGDQQARQIDRLLMARLSPREYEARQIVCGSSASFQGDERDVMFLSLVDTPAAAPLSLRTADGFKKRFNVAASRARDQMWVVHSLDPARDLKAGDLRLQLIRHAESASEPERGSDDAEHELTPFQLAIYRGLVEAGFRVQARWKIGMETVDLVVLGARGRRLGLLCDGDASVPPAELGNRLRWQEVLERLGWRFLRVRASSYYRRPAETLQCLAEELREHGIEPCGQETASSPDGAAERLARVRSRAEQLLREWRGVQDPTEVVADGEEELDLELFEPVWHPLVRALAALPEVTVEPGGDLAVADRVIGAYVAEISRSGKAVRLVDSRQTSCLDVVRACHDEGYATVTARAQDAMAALQPILDALEAAIPARLAAAEVGEAPLSLADPVEECPQPSPVPVVVEEPSAPAPPAESPGDLIGEVVEASWRGAVRSLAFADGGIRLHPADGSSPLPEFALWLRGEAAVQVPLVLSGASWWGETAAGWPAAVGLAAGGRCLGSLCSPELPIPSGLKDPRHYLRLLRWMEVPLHSAGMRRRLQGLAQQNILASLLAWGWDQEVEVDSATLLLPAPSQEWMDVVTELLWTWRPARSVQALDLVEALDRETDGKGAWLLCQVHPRLMARVASKVVEVMRGDGVGVQDVTAELRQWIARILELPDGTALAEVSRRWEALQAEVARDSGVSASEVPELLRKDIGLQMTEKDRVLFERIQHRPGFRRLYGVLLLEDLTADLRRNR